MVLTVSIDTCAPGWWQGPPPPPQRSSPSARYRAAAAAPARPLPCLRTPRAPACRRGGTNGRPPSRSAGRSYLPIPQQAGRKSAIIACLHTSILQNARKPQSPPVAFDRLPVICMGLPRNHTQVQPECRSHQKVQHTVIFVWVHLNGTFDCVPCMHEFMTPDSRVGQALGHAILELPLQAPVDSDPVWGTPARACSIPATSGG